MREGDLMDYVIGNPDNNLYIRLDPKGRAVTCAEKYKQKFSVAKATSILRCLPKTLRKFNFSLIPEKEHSLQKENYVLPKMVEEWIQKASDVNLFATEIKNRRNFLLKELSNADRILSNHLHEIELLHSKSACDGYKEYKTLKEELEKRREIKDELCVVESILHCKLEKLTPCHLQKIVNGLANRKFTYRELEMGCFDE